MTIDSMFATKLCAILVPMIQQAYRPDCCIAATAIVKRVCAALDIPAEPLVVRTIVYNPTYRQLIETYGIAAPEGDLVEMWRQAGAHSVAVGYGRDGSGVAMPGMWAGHLVAVIRPHRRRASTLVDLSLPQVNRPDRGIVVSPVIMPITPQILTGQDIAVGLLNECLLRYEAIPHDHSYVQSPDWANRATQRQIVRQELEQLRKEVSRDFLAHLRVGTRSISAYRGSEDPHEPAEKGG